MLAHRTAAPAFWTPTAHMAAANPELQAKLQELDHELDEGDITLKGSV